MYHTILCYIMSMKLGIIGAGPAGIMAAIAASTNGHEVHLYEKNDTIGKKLSITGNGRCNLTNRSPLQEFLSHINGNEKFLYSSFHSFFHEDLINLFHENGLEVKEEDRNRVFPVTDSSQDVICCLQTILDQNHVHLHLHAQVHSLWIEDNICKGILLDQETIPFDCVIVCTGGISYPMTGSTGDGMRFAQEAGMTVNPLSPGLVPFTSGESWIPTCQGLSLRNVGIRLGSQQGISDVLITQDGLSGPFLLNASRHWQQGQSVLLDFFPSDSFADVDHQLLEKMSQSPNKKLMNTLTQILPKRLIPAVLDKAGLSQDILNHQVTKKQRHQLVHTLKEFTVSIAGTKGWNRAMITKGGIHLSQIDPKTMESKSIRYLKFAGEVLDLDADTGGYNLQIAWSTGWIAGHSIKKDGID